MRRSYVVPLMLLSFATVVSAQTPPQVDQLRVFVNGFANASPMKPNDIVARMKTFDRDNDGVVSVAELPERMHNLITEGDANLNGTLEESEIRTLAVRPSANAVRGFGGGGGYGFGDENGGVSSRMHIQGALEDLRLADAKKTKAFGVADAFVDALEANASAALLHELGSLLTLEQLATFKTALDRQAASSPVSDSELKVAAFHVFGVGRDLERRINTFGLTQTDRAQAFAAIQRYRTRLRASDAERSELIARMKGILSDEERDNLRAALARRPLVKAGGVVTGASFSVVVQPKGEAVTVRPAVLRTITPAPLSDPAQ